MHDIVFNEPDHTYTVDGVPKDSVTTILKSLGLDDYSMVPPDVLENARRRGQAAHDVIRDEVNGTLDLATIEDEMIPYYDAWMCFRQTSGFEPLLSEAMVYSKRHDYVGTLDLAGTLKRTKLRSSKRIVVDTKCTAMIMPSAAIQTAGYEIALAETIGISERMDRYVLHLKDGRFKLVPMQDTRDHAVFLSALNIHRWKKEQKR
jgi:hypothetical protein